VRTLVLIIAVTLGISAPPAGGNDAQRLAEASRNYLKLEKIYMHWNEPWFRKGGYYRQVMYDYLVDLIGKEIHTDHTFMLVSPESIYRQEVQCQVRSGRWLHIVGKFSIADIKKIIGDDIGLLKGWWRSRKMIAVYGKVRRFRIDETETRKEIVLYLETVHVRE